MPRSPSETVARGRPHGADRTVGPIEQRPLLLLAGRYEIERAVGGGGMGTVLRARDRHLDRIVAVKVLPAGRAADAAAVARFEREARAAAALSHPNIVSVFDAGSDGPTRFIVMEFVPGMSLAEVLRREGRLAPARAAALAAQTARALAAAHRAGIVHRDVKPGNVMVDRVGHVKLLDFGIARARESASLTQTGSIFGSSPYIAPEVARGEPAVARSDVYALGCLLYELLTGCPPFTAELPAAVLQQHLVVTPRPPRELEPGVPAALSSLVLSMLAKDPADRPRAEEVLRALERPGQLRLPRPASRRAPPTARLVGPAPRRRRIRAGALAAALALLATLALVLAAASGDGGEPAGRAGARTRPSQTAGAPWTAVAFAAARWDTAAQLGREAFSLLESARAAEAAAAPAPATPAPHPKGDRPHGHGEHGRGHGNQDAANVGGTLAPAAEEPEAPSQD
jgi:serine/threonine-protein kinase